MVGLKSNKDPYQIQMAVDKLVEVCVALLIYLSPKKKKKKKWHYAFSILFNYF
jgi:hypothetical protein